MTLSELPACWNIEACPGPCPGVLDLAQLELVPVAQIQPWFTTHDGSGWCWYINANIKGVKFNGSMLPYMAYMDPWFTMKGGPSGNAAIENGP